MLKPPSLIKNIRDIGAYRFLKSFENSQLAAIIMIDAENPANDKNICLLFTDKVGKGRALEIKSKHYSASAGFKSVLRNTDKKIIDVISSSSEKDNDVTLVQKSDVEKELARIVLKASEIGASDLHVRVQDRLGTEVSFRYGAKIIPFERHGADFGHQLISTVMGYLLKQGASTTYQRNKEQVGTYEYHIDNLIYRMRLVSFPIEGGMKMVARIAKLDASGVPSLTFERAGYLPQQILRIRAAIASPEGAIIMAGITGSGKTTTLQAMACEMLKNNDTEMISVEDPVELIIKGASQISVSEAMSFESGLRVAMRGDPDSILIGEIRDKMSAKTAVQAAITGHNVLATTHSSSPLAINLRLEEFGISRKTMGSDAFYKLLMYQKLIPHICPDCSVLLNSPEANIIGPDILHSDAAWLSFRNRWDSVFDAATTSQKERVKNARLHDPHGCEKCLGGELSRRSVLAEVMSMDDVILDHIMGGEDRKAKNHWLKEGGISRTMHALEKVLNGDVCAAVAERYAGVITHDMIFADGKISKREIAGLGGHVETRVADTEKQNLR